MAVKDVHDVIDVGQAGTNAAVAELWMRNGYFFNLTFLNIRQFSEYPGQSFFIAFPFLWTNILGVKHG